MSVDWHAKAMEALPVLVERAHRGKTITYGELGEEIDVHHRNVRHALQVIRDDICEGGGRAPMINALVIRQGGGSGSEVFGLQGCLLSEERREQAVREEQCKVFKYDGWDELLAEYGLSLRE